MAESHNSHSLAPCPNVVNLRTLTNHSMVHTPYNMFPTALPWAIMSMHLRCALSAERIFILGHANGMVIVTI